jgi:cytochrome c oxidase subunit I+III
MIGARDMAFPRLNAFSFWAFLAAGIFIHVSLLLGEAPDAGWFNYVPLALKPFAPGSSIDFYSFGLLFVGVSTTATAINIVTTIFKLRAPGMSLNRMPLFCYAQLAAAGSALFLLPPLTLDLVLLELQRKAGFHFFDVQGGGSPLLWQHLFWLFGHPEVYLIVLPAFGIATSIIPAFAKRRMIAAPLVALAELLVAFIGFGVWAHHMFTTGMGTATMVFFSAATLMVVIPSTIQIFAWLFTVSLGRPDFRTPLLFIGGFITFFVLGGLTGIMFAAIPFDQAVTDTYFVVAHFHFIIFGAAVFPILGGFYYWFPKVTGRMYHEGWAKASFWLTFLGTALTFFPMHIVGLLGMPRRVYTYPGGLGWDAYNLSETIGAYVLAAGLLLLVANLAVSRVRGPFAGPNPWNAPTLEWQTSSPPPPYNFAAIPRVGSEYPGWDPPAPGPLIEAHAQPLSSVRDGELDEVIELPAESAWPIVLAGCLAIVFTLLLTSHYAAAAISGAVAALVVAAWHWQEPRDAARPAGRSQPAGWWGIALFVATEATLLACVIGTYLYLRFKNVHWPPAGLPEPKVLVPLILTAVLVATSVPMQLAWRAARDLRVGRARLLLAAALAVQAGYLALQVHLYLDDLHRFVPQAHAYASVYYVLLGAGHAHVALGILLNLFLLARLSGGPTRYRLVGVRTAAFYWHFVNVATLALVATQLSVAL